MRDLQACLVGVGGGVGVLVAVGVSEGVGDGVVVGRAVGPEGGANVGRGVIVAGTLANCTDDELTRAACAISFESWLDVQLVKMTSAERASRNRTCLLLFVLKKDMKKLTIHPIGAVTLILLSHVKRREVRDSPASLLFSLSCLLVYKYAWPIWGFAFNRSDDGRLWHLFFEHGYIFW